MCYRILEDKLLKYKKDFMQKIQLLTTTLLIASSALSFNLLAEIYTWTDKNGKVHFSDKPTSDENVTTIKPKENRNSANTVITNNQWQQDYNKTKQVKAQKAQEEAKLTRKNQDYCNQLKRQLAVISEGGRIYVMSPDGKRNFKSEEQLKAEKKKINNAYKKTCR